MICDDIIRLQVNNHRVDCGKKHHIELQSRSLLSGIPIGYNAIYAYNII